jgi:phosphohistidine phosphatase
VQMCKCGKWIVSFIARWQLCFILQLMKTVYLVRHAKSDWAVAAEDRDRPLNDRGKRDAPMMANRLLERKAKVDRFMSSPAKRAFSTAGAFAFAYNRKKSDIVEIPELYLPSPETFFSVMEKLDDKDKFVAIFSHNSGITEFANSLQLIKLDNMPTCSIFAFRIKSDNWESVRKAEKEFMFFDYPKKP